jgi:hypothetical protein
MTADIAEATPSMPPPLTAAAALRDLLEQLEGIGIAVRGQDEGQWAGTEGLSLGRAYAAARLSD